MEMIRGRVQPELLETAMLQYRNKYPDRKITVGEVIRAALATMTNQDVEKYAQVTRGKPA
jgi:hypothetical protein